MSRLLLTGKCATHNLKAYAILVYEHVHILWTNEEVKITKMIF